MYYDDNDKLLNGQTPQRVQVTPLGPQNIPQPQQFNIPEPQQQTQPELDPTDGSTGQPAGGDQSSLVNPGSVGSAVSSQSGGAPAWTNIQAYLNANDATSPAMSQLNESTKNLAQNEREKLDQYENIRQPFKQAYENYQQVAGVNKDVLKSHLNKQTLHAFGKPFSNYTPLPGNVRNFFDRDLNGIQLNPYEVSDEYKDLKRLAETPEGFQDHIRDSYRQAAGRELTGGQQALQEQIDLSGGAFKDIRGRALEQLAGVDNVLETANQYNDSLEQDLNRLAQMRQHKQSLHNSIKSDGDLYLKKFAEDRWDPVKQKQGELLFDQVMQNVRNRAREGMDFAGYVNSYPYGGWGKADYYLDGYGKAARAPYDRMMTYQRHRRDPDAFIRDAREVGNHLQAVWNGQRHPYRTHGNNVMAALDNYLNNNYQSYRDTFF